MVSLTAFSQFFFTPPLIRDVPYLLINDDYLGNSAKPSSTDNTSTATPITIAFLNRELADRRTTWGVQELLQGKEVKQPVMQVIAAKQADQ